MTEDERLDAIMAVMEAAFDPFWREAWTRSQVASSLSLPHTHAILVGADGNGELSVPAAAAGFVLARRVPGEEELLLIGVRPDHRGNGLGMKLLTLFEESARSAGAEKVFLEMRDGNRAERLYLRAGFEVIGRRKDYYRTVDGGTLDAITYGKSIA